MLKTSYCYSNWLLSTTVFIYLTFLVCGLKSQSMLRRSVFCNHTFPGGGGGGGGGKLRPSGLHILSPTTDTQVGISGTTAKSRIRKSVPSSHPGPFVVVASSRKRQTKVGTLACFDFL